MQGSRLAEQESVKNRTEKMEKDIISTMPNEIIAMILSLLTIKEAGRTSVLSGRWRYLWTFFSGMLSFDHSLGTYITGRQRVPALQKSIRHVKEWERCMSIMDGVLTTLKSPSLQGLKICVDLGNPDKMAEWVRYAAEKDVQLLELDFSFHFPVMFFKISQTIRNVLNLKSTNVEMKSLRVLRLASVDVTGEVIQHFLASSPFLETLSVKESMGLVRLKVWGVGLRLKHLELVECHILYLDIYAENLMTFSYSGDYGKFNFEYVPSLVEASFGGRYASYLQPNMGDIDVYELLCMIQHLKLDLSVHDLTYLEGLLQFTNVQHLELLLPHGCGTRLDRAASLLTAFPSISVLKVKFKRYKLWPQAEQEWKAYMKGELTELGELHVSGYRRDRSQVELLISIFENAPKLNKVVVDPLSAAHVHRSTTVKDRIRESGRYLAIWYADGLKRYLPPQVELIVL